MQYVIDAINHSEVEAITALRDLVSGSDFIKKIQVDRYTYEFEYEIQYEKIIEDPHCLPDLQEEVFPLLALINAKTETLLLEVIKTIAEHSLKIGGRIYPDTLIWKNQELPAGLDFAYALALYNIEHCRSLGDYLLSTDPDHDVYQVDIVNSLIKKYGIENQTLYLLGSYALHGSFGNDNIMEFIRDAKYKDPIKKLSAPLIERLEEINSLAKDVYKKQVNRIRDAVLG